MKFDERKLFFFIVSVIYSATLSTSYLPWKKVNFSTSNCYVPLVDFGERERAHLFQENKASDV